jgi:hypothetical protein
MADETEVRQEAAEAPGIPLGEPELASGQPVRRTGETPRQQIRRGRPGGSGLPEGGECPAQAVGSRLRS